MADEGVKKADMRRNLGQIENRRPSSVLGNKERTIYEALCRNEVPVVRVQYLADCLAVQSPKDTSKLYCYYKRDRPYLVYAPLKVEIMRFSPLAVLFKDVISDDEISVIQELAKPRVCSVGIIKQNFFSWPEPLFTILLLENLFTHLTESARGK